MRILKRLSKLPSLRRFACWLVACYVRLVYYTSRWEIIGADVRDRYILGGKPAICTFWHGRLLVMPVIWPKGLPLYALISKHHDGELIARTIGHLGFDTVRGSAKTGGVGALKSILGLLKAGKHVAITPDGPRGPRMRVSGAVTQIAAKTGFPVIPMVTATSRRRMLRTWDRFLVAYPFSKGVMIYGEPLFFDNSEPLDGANARLEKALNSLAAEADRRVGAVPVEPA